MAKIDMPTSSLNQTPGQQPKKKLEKVTTGKVTVRQQTDIQKVASAFLAEDLATVKERIINDYAIPMLKNGMRYAEFCGVKWKVTDVKVQYPRLILTFGGIYHE